MAAYTVLIVGWVIYFFLHSWLATERVKKWNSRWVSSRTYRLLYNAFATVGLLMMLWINSSIPATIFFASERYVRFFSLLIVTLGVLLIRAHFRASPASEFLGLAATGPAQLRVDGILRHIRHPLYAGIILITTGFFFFIPKLPVLITCSCILLYLPIGIWLEEQKLLQQFGDTFRQYRKTVPALLPWPRKN